MEVPKMKVNKFEKFSIKRKSKLFYLKHKSLVDGFVVSALSGIAIYASAKSIEYKYANEINQLKDELEFVNDELASEKAIHELEVLEKNSRIAELENLSDEKDAGYLYLVSDAMRHGSSYAASEMSYYKNEVKPLSE